MSLQKNVWNWSSLCEMKLTRLRKTNITCFFSYTESRFKTKHEIIRNTIGKRKVSSRSGHKRGKREWWICSKCIVYMCENVNEVHWTAKSKTAKINKYQARRLWSFHPKLKAQEPGRPMFKERSWMCQVKQRVNLLSLHIFIVLGSSIDWVIAAYTSISHLPYPSYQLAI
jgi:hypothetical protein